METTKQNQSEEKEKTWREKLFETFTGNVELLKTFFALLANPLMVSGAMVAFVCWSFRSREDGDNVRRHNIKLRAKLKKVRSKYKKLKKEYKKQAQNPLCNKNINVKGNAN